MQNISIMGNVGRVELRAFGDTPCLRLSVAVNARQKLEDGTWGEKTTWYSVNVLGKRAESLAKVVDKGCRVACSGELKVKHDGDKLWLNIDASELFLAFTKDRHPASSPAKTDDNLPF